MATTTDMLTLAQFEKTIWPEDGRKRELVRGLVVEAPMPGGQHNWIRDTIHALLREFILARRLGAVFNDSMPYLLDPDGPTERIPDVSFVAYERVILPLPGVWPFAPDLAVEIVSPNDRKGEIEAKVQDYLAAGTRLVWVLWPDTQTVTVHAPDAEPCALTADDMLDGGDVLPGFAVPIASLFAVDL